MVGTQWLAACRMPKPPGVVRRRVQRRLDVVVVGDNFRACRLPRSGFGLLASVEAKRRDSFRGESEKQKKLSTASRVFRFSRVSRFGALGCFCLGPMSRILPDAWCLWATILGLSLGQCFTAQFCLLWTTWSIKEAAMSSLSLVFWEPLLLSHHASAPQLSALRPGKQHHPWHVAPMVAASLWIVHVQLEFVRNAVSLISSNLSASTLLMSTFEGRLSRRLNGGGTLRALHHKVAAIKRERHANQRRAIRV